MERKKKISAGIGPVCPEKCKNCDSTFRVSVLLFLLFTHTRYQVGGPFWDQPLHNVEFLTNVINYLNSSSEEEFRTHKRLLGLLSVAREELDCPFFFDYHSMCKRVKVSVPKLITFSSAILSLGYKLSPTHCTPNGLKTNAPPEALWSILRAWRKQCHNTKSIDALSQYTVAYKILSRGDEEEEKKVDFTHRSDAIAKSADIPRFLPNPRISNPLIPFLPLSEKNWGPGTKAGKKRYSDDTKNRFHFA